MVAEVIALAQRQRATLLVELVTSVATAGAVVIVQATVALTSIFQQQAGRHITIRLWDASNLDGDPIGGTENIHKTIERS